MKHDKSLKIENLEKELFTEELGQVHGGNLSSTSVKAGFEVMDKHGFGGTGVGNPGFGGTGVGNPGIVGGWQHR
jgi:hypothetical protein